MIEMRRKVDDKRSMMKVDEEGFELTRRIQILNLCRVVPYGGYPRFPLLGSMITFAKLIKHLYLVIACPHVYSFSTVMSAFQTQVTIIIYPNSKSTESLLSHKSYTRLLAMSRNWSTPGHTKMSTHQEELNRAESTPSRYFFNALINIHI